VRTPRQSERYSSLARVDTINGAPADSVAEGTRYEDLAVAYPSERLELDPQDPTLGAIEWLTPIGRGSRASLVGEARSGKTETLRRLLGALAGRNGDASGTRVSPGIGREGLEVMLVLGGVRPEEIAAWREGPVAPAAALDLGASSELQAQTVEHVVDTAKRVAARGGHVVVLIDTLDHLPPHAARRILAGARNLVEGGSLTLIATATRPLGGESTVIALDVALTSTGRIPALDLAASGVVRPELLVGEDGAAAITKARASALAG
jgi:transcription termination factor Rho